MANRLKMAEVQAFVTLRARDRSFRRIGWELGAHRESAARYARLAEAAQADDAGDGSGQNRPNLPTGAVGDRESGRAMELTLVFPESANPQEDRISVMSPLGAAILGYSAGDQFSFEVPAGTRSYEIVEVLYQLEAAGHLHL